MTAFIQRALITAGLFIFVTFWHPAGNASAQNDSMEQKLKEMKGLLIQKFALKESDIEVIEEIDVWFEKGDSAKIEEKEVDAILIKDKSPKESLKLLEMAKELKKANISPLVLQNDEWESDYLFIIGKQRSPQEAYDKKFQEQKNLEQILSQFDQPGFKEKFHTIALRHGPEHIDAYLAFLKK